MGRARKGLGLMHQNFYTASEKEVDDRLSKEIGTRLVIKKGCRVSALNMNITSNDFKSLKFRINFYKIQKGIPGELLNQRDYIFEIKDGFLGWYKVDLSGYDIFLDENQKEIAVCIQWLESEKKNKSSKYFSISTKIASTKSAFYRERAMGKWKSFKAKPSLYLDAECR